MRLDTSMKRNRSLGLCAVLILSTIETETSVNAFAPAPRPFLLYPTTFSLKSCVVSNSEASRRATCLGSTVSTATDLPATYSGPSAASALAKRAQAPDGTRSNDRGSRAGELRRAVLGCVQEGAWNDAMACLELASKQRIAAAELYQRTSADLQRKQQATSATVADVGSDTPSGVGGPEIHHQSTNSSSIAVGHGSHNDPATDTLGLAERQLADWTVSFNLYKAVVEHACVAGRLPEAMATLRLLTADVELAAAAFKERAEFEATTSLVREEARSSKHAAAKLSATSTAPPARVLQASPGPVIGVARANEHVFAQVLDLASSGRVPAGLDGHRATSTVVPAAVGLEASEEIVGLMARCKVQPSVNVFAMRFAASGRAKDKHAVQATLRDLAAAKGAGRTRGLVPDLVCLNAAIQALVACDQVDQAEAMVAAMVAEAQRRELPSKGVEDSSARAFKNFFSESALSADGKTSSVVPEGLLLQPPDARSFNLLMRGLAQRGAPRDLSACLAMPAEMALLTKQHQKTCRKCAPDDVTANTLIDAVANARGGRAAATLIEELEASATADDGEAARGEHQHGSEPSLPVGVAGFRASVAGWTAAVGALAADGDVAGAAALVARMRASSASRSSTSSSTSISMHHLAPTVVTYTALLSGLASAGRYEAARQVFASLLAHPDEELKPTAVTYNTMVAMECNAGNLGAARELIQQVQAAGLGPDIVALNSLLQGLVQSSFSSGMVGAAESWADASSSYSTFSELGANEEGILPMVEAEQILESMEVNGPLPNAYTWATLIAGYGQRQDLPNARRLFHRACVAASSGTCERDVAVLNAYLAACVKAGVSATKAATSAFSSYGKSSMDSWSKDSVSTEQSPMTEALALLAEVTSALDKAAATAATTQGRRRKGGNSKKSAGSSTEHLFEDKGWNEVDSGFSLFSGGVKAVSNMASHAAAEANSPFAADASESAAARIFKDKGWNQVDSGFSFFGVPFDDAPHPLPPRARTLAEVLTAAQAAQRTPADATLGAAAANSETTGAVAAAASSGSAVAAAVGLPDVVTYGTLIGGLSRSSDPNASQEAWRLWQQLRQRHVAPDERLVESLLQCLAKWPSVSGQAGDSRLSAWRAVEADLNALGWDIDELMNRSGLSSPSEQTWKVDPTKSEAWKAS